MTPRSELIINEFKRIIQKNDFQLLKLYPSDLDSDQRILAKLEGWTGTVGWCIGDTHSHMAVLGVVDSMNDMVENYVDLAKSDKFYKVELRAGNDFRVIQLDKTQYLDLKKTPILYSFKGNSTDFEVQDKQGNTLAHFKKEEQRKKPMDAADTLELIATMEPRHRAHVEVVQWFAYAELYRIRRETPAYSRQYDNVNIVWEHQKTKAVNAPVTVKTNTAQHQLI